MTLAVMLGFLLLASPSWFPAFSARQDAQQPAPASNTTADQTNTQPKKPSTEPKQTPTTANPAASPSGQKPAAGKRPVRKKKSSPPDCNPAPATSPDTTASTVPAAASQSPKVPSGGDASSAKTAPNSTGCPPSKTVVRQGGASEPPIHMAVGPAGDQAAQQRETSAEMLEAADLNLKQVEARQLTAGQQDMVKQVRQFMQQSKAATAAGDLDRARTLAWKAQLLSEELANPQK